MANDNAKTHAVHCTELPQMIIAIVSTVYSTGMYKSCLGKWYTMSSVYTVQCKHHRKVFCSYIRVGRKHCSLAADIMSSAYAKIIPLNLRRVAKGVVCFESGKCSFSLKWTIGFFLNSSPLLSVLIYNIFFYIKKQ